MRRHTRDGLMEALEEIAQDLEAAEQRADEVASKAHDLARESVRAGVLEARCRTGAIQLRAAIDVYLRGKR
jgi:hypothetical protein